MSINEQEKDIQSVSLSLYKLLNSISYWKNDYKLINKDMLLGKINPLHTKAYSYLSEIEKRIFEANLNETFKLPQKVNIPNDLNTAEELKIWNQINPTEAKIVKKRGGAKIIVEQGEI